MKDVGHPAEDRNPPRIGLIVNPIAGMGGRLGRHGTDSLGLLEATELGAHPVAGPRALRAMALIARAIPDVEVWTASGAMGEEVVRAVVKNPTVVEVKSDPTTACDTRRVAMMMSREGLDLILFAGGDGTASDIAASIGTETPMLGIPTGVKMHSAVFGTTPEATGELTVRFLATRGAIHTRTREVIDVAPDSTDVRRVSAAAVPHDVWLLQHGKATYPVGGDESLKRLCGQIAAQLLKDHLYFIGPGTTTTLLLDHLDLEGTLAGVDVLLNGEMIKADASESELHQALDMGLPATIILGVIGGQGFLLGRGNQQLSPSVVTRVGEGNVQILASEDKVARLAPPVLRVDAGDEAAAPVMLGYRRVHVAPGRSVVMRVVS